VFLRQHGNRLPVNGHAHRMNKRIVNEGCGGRKELHGPLRNPAAECHCAIKARC